MSVQDAVAKLKEEGNTFFSQKDYIQASLKYTDALAIDDKSNTAAILYSNRAACRFYLGRYMDAASDGDSAVKIDSKYAKAYARKAAAFDALQMYHVSIQCWESALSCLLEKDNSPAILSQRQQYKVALSNAKQAENQLLQTKAPIVSIPMGEKGHWDFAAEVVEQKRANQDIMSSSWIINEANIQFTSAIRYMKELEVSKEGQEVFGNTGAVMDLCNAIIMDERIFRIDSEFSPQEWLKKYNSQVRFEVKAFKVHDWMDAGPNRIMQEAPERLKSNGWSDLRPAISTIMRAWIIRGFFDGGFSGNNDNFVEFLSRAIEVIEWGRELWKCVPKEERGAIFSQTFLWGVKKLHLTALIKAWSANPQSHDIEDLFTAADELLKETENVNLRAPPPGEEITPGFFLAFYVYTRAEALVTRAFYHCKLADGQLQKIRDLYNVDKVPRDDRTIKMEEETTDHYQLAVKDYVAAADLYCEDDERRPYFLKVVLPIMWNCPTPAAVQLAALDKLRTCLPKVNRIWNNSPSMRSIKGELDKLLEIEKQLQEAVSSGSATLNDCVCLNIES